MRARSHVDLILQIPVIHVELLEADAREAEASSAEAVFAKWREEQRSMRLLFHESFHFWQCLGLPFLQWYAITGFLQSGRLVSQVVQQVGHPRTWPDNLCARPDPDSLGFVRLPNALSFAAPARLRFGPGAAADTDALPDAYVNFTLLDLLENAAAIAEFQFSAPSGGPVDHRSFRIWANRQPAHTGVIKFLIAAWVRSSDFARRYLS